MDQVVGRVRWVHGLVEEDARASGKLAVRLVVRGVGAVREPAVDVERERWTCVERLYSRLDPERTDLARPVELAEGQSVTWVPVEPERERRGEEPFEQALRAHAVERVARRPDRARQPPGERRERHEPGRVVQVV